VTAEDVSETLNRAECPGARVTLVQPRRCSRCSPSLFGYATGTCTTSSQLRDSVVTSVKFRVTVEPDVTTETHDHAQGV
jgi:hypothetical protein